MENIVVSMIEFIRKLLFNEALSPEPLSEEHRQFLDSKVTFYSQLADEDKSRFEQRCSALYS